MSIQRRRCGKHSGNGCQICGGDVLSQSVRSEIVDFLHRELIGPDPGLPAQQLNREEILRPQDPPRLRYSAGVLFPMKAAVAVAETATEAEVDQNGSGLSEGEELDNDNTGVGD